jgi:sugar transferase (PEP-CTERM/EpsH1 system associated)
MKRLLFISHRLPYPPDKGERVRAFHEIRALAERFRITLAAPSFGADHAAAAEGLRPWCQDTLVAPAGGTIGLARGTVSLLGGGSVTQAYFRSRRLHRMIRAASRAGPFDLVMGYSSSTLPYVLAAPAKARVLDLVDVDSVKWAGYAASSSWPKSWLYKREAAGVRALECRAVEACDAVVLVSGAECASLGVQAGSVTAIGNGVDVDYFRPDETEAESRCGAGLVFTGTMDYRPNVEGVCWFVREIWPGLKRQAPDLTFTIVGRDPSSAVRRLSETPGVKVTGTVPDVRPYLSAADVAICPLRMARGIQNKILEAMAMGKAVVASGPAAEGLDVEPGRHLLIAEAANEWQAAVMELLTDSERRRMLGREARGCVATKYTWSSRMAPLVSLCASLVGEPDPADGGEPLEKQ